MKLNFIPITHEAALPIIEIRVDNYIIDLHNACEFLGMNFNITDCSVITNWKYFPDYDEKHFLCFKIAFHGINKFNIKSWDKQIPFNQNQILDDFKIDTENGGVILEFNGNLVIELYGNKAVFDWIRCNE